MGDPSMLPAALRFGVSSVPTSVSPGVGMDTTIDKPTPILDPLVMHRKLMSHQKLPSGIGGPGSGMGAAGLFMSGSVAPAPSLYEMAALTHELDTQSVTTKVKEILLANNVGQKLFGEAVLGLSQGSVSELLSKPKPWHMLSIKGREPFIRMQLWLNDPQNIEKLQTLKNEKKDINKRKRPAGAMGGSGVDSNSDRSSPADPSDIYASSADSPGSSGAKKQRVLFTDEQKEALKIAFALDPYPSTAATEFLCQELNLESRSITNWFHNHRMRLKQQLPQGMESLAPLLSKGTGDGQQNFDPVKFRLIFHQRILEMQQGSNDDGSPALSMSSMLLRQFGHAPLVSLTQGGDALDHLKDKDAPIAPGSGLDLSFKRGDDDKDSIAVEEQSPSGQSDHEDSRDIQDDDLETERERARAALLAAAVAANNRSSRRKPAAPQWVRPEWMEKEGGEDRVKQGENTPTNGVSKDNMTINGVCVMNSYAFGKDEKEADNDAANDKTSNNEAPISVTESVADGES